MSDVPTLGQGSDNRLFQQFLAQYDAPAFVRRARRVQETLDELLGRCRQQRDKWVVILRIRVGQLKALAGDWTALRRWLADDAQLDALERLHLELAPQLRMPVEPTTSSWRLRSALREVAASVETFNQRWQAFLHEQDLSRVNEVREGYNRYYVLEKECAVRSARVAQLGFRPLEPFTHEQLAELLPPLPVPRLAV